MSNCQSKDLKGSKRLTGCKGLKGSKDHTGSKGLKGFKGRLPRAQRLLAQWTAVY